jgi:hypothetical protein
MGHCRFTTTTMSRSLGTCYTAYVAHQAEGHGLAARGLRASTTRTRRMCRKRLSESCRFQLN